MIEVIITVIRMAAIMNITMTGETIGTMAADFLA
jgi:hypothetical protein